jgi:hypothetical protein
MARRTTMLPMPGTNRGGMGFRVIGTVVGLVMFALLLRDPIGAAGAVEQAGAWCAAALDALARFGTALSS